MLDFQERLVTTLGGGISAASAWKITTKHPLGRLPGVEPLAVDVQREIKRSLA